MSQEKKRAILVGCGGISSAWLKGVAPLSELEVVGLVDLDESRARKRATEFNLPQAVIETDLDRALDRCRPDMVFDCTVPEAHVTVASKALARGCHVLAEKPLADSMENARLIVDAARKAGRVHAVMQNRRYLPTICRCRNALGQIGRLTTLNSDFYIGAHFGGFRDRMKHVLLLDMAIHTFDQARFISGAEPVAVYCREWNPPGSWYDHEASAVAVFQMSNGLVYTYRGSWCSEGMHTGWEADWRAIGTGGTLLWNGGEGFKGQAVVKAAGFNSEFRPIEVAADPARERSGGHAGMLKEAVARLLAGQTPETVCTDNIRSLAMVFGAIRSAEERREVPVEA
jgi:predicted dehydrogenase